jgi:hypothetical protein
MKLDNEIFGINFNRHKKKHHRIVLLLRKEIPDMGYGTKELRQLLKQYENKYKLKK